MVRRGLYSLTQEIMGSQGKEGLLRFLNDLAENPESAFIVCKCYGLSISEDEIRVHSDDFRRLAEAVEAEYDCLTGDRSEYRLSFMQAYYPHIGTFEDLRNPEIWEALIKEFEAGKRLTGEQSAGLRAHFEAANRIIEAMPGFMQKEMAEQIRQSQILGRS